LQQHLQQAAAEENDHLAWCAERLQELHSRPSVLNPLWYSGALFLGMLAGALGDRWNLGFLAETERQVTQHLEKHLQELPQNDEKSRQILLQMREDEMQHATVAVQQGGMDLPQPLPFMMRMMSKVMTTLAYRL
jgi:ubiquinone biosynthesis monooxygenase Coq7